MILDSGLLFWATLYGQISTTPSCVYGRLFTWTRMVDFNALIVWKTFIDICFSIKLSLWALTAAYTKFRRMIGSIIWSCATGHIPRCVAYCYLIETSGDFTWKKLKAYNFVISGWVRCWSAILLSPILPPTSAPPLFSEGLGYHDGKIVELKMFAGTF